MAAHERGDDELWCEHCSRLVHRAELEVDAEGDAHCPHCAGVVRERHPGEERSEDEGAPKAPWHFKVLLVGTVIYLVYRLIWFILWLSHRA